MANVGDRAARRAGGELMEQRRDVHLRTALSVVRSELWEGREHLVVPCVALQEGVIHAINAAEPEYVPLETLVRTVGRWNGHPLVVGHPVRNGTQVSAHDPELLAQHQVGFIRATRVSGSRLGMEVLVDPKRLEVLGQHRLLTALRNGEQVELSVGAYVRTAARNGEDRNGKVFKAEWVDILPDHLALLPQGRGACSIEMGCGAHRAASQYVELGDFHFTAACGCQETTMAKKKDEMVSALLQNDHNPLKGQKAALEALDEAGLTALEAHCTALAKAADEAKAAEAKAAADLKAAEAKTKTVEERLTAAEASLKEVRETPLTSEQFLSIAPPDMKDMLERYQAREAAEKSELVAQLKTAAAHVYTEEALKAMPVEQLGQIAKLIKLERPTSTVDYSGRRLARPEKVDEKNSFDPPDPYEAQLKNLRERAVN